MVVIDLLLRLLLEFYMILLWFAGCELTVKTMCSIFKEVTLEEPNWQTVSKQLGLDLYGQVSAEELYQAWCTHSPSWERLSQALGKFQEYKEVANKAKKKAGMRGVLLHLSNVNNYV